MSWTAPSGHTWTTGEVVTAANFNAYITNDLLDLDRRLTVKYKYVATGETTTSTTYTVLTTPGPTIALVTGVICLVGLDVEMTNNTANVETFCAHDISGATVSAASDGNNRNVRTSQVFSGSFMSAGAAYYMGVTAGVNMFTLKYRVSAGTGTFAKRWVWGVPIGAA